MTDPEHDEVFEAHLKRRGVLPALDEGVEPPSQVDERVLAEAREAIQPRVPVQSVGGRPERSASGAARSARLESADADILAAVPRDSRDDDSRAGAVGARVGEAGRSGSRTAAGATHASDDSRGGDNVVPLAAAKPPMQRPPRWAVPVALAATVLLCLSVVINISLNTNRPSPNLARMTAARADTKASALSNATAEADAAGGVPARAKSGAAPAQSGAARDQLAESDGERREGVSGEIPSREVVLPRARVAGVAAPRAPVEAEGTAPGSVAAAAPATTSSATGAAAGAFASAGGPARAVAPAPSATVAQSNTAAAGASGTLDASSGGLSESVEARVAELKAAAPATPGGRSASAADKAVLFAKQAGVSSHGAPPAAAPTAAAAGQPAAKAGPGVGAAGHPSDPKVWLQQIDALRAAGKNAQADAEMRRFVVAFPDYAGKAAAPASPDLPK